MIFWILYYYYARAREGRRKEFQSGTLANSSQQLRRLPARVLDRGPYLEGGGGHGHVAHSQRRKGVEDGADHHRQGRGATAFAAGLDAKRVGRRQDLDDPRRKKWQTIRARHAVIHERTRQGLARGWIDDTFFPHRLAYPLGDTAMGLPVHDQGVDAAPDVVDNRIAGDLHQSGFGIDLDLATRAAIRKDRIVHLVVGRDRKLTFGAEPRRLLCQFEKIEAAVVWG